MCESRGGGPRLPHSPYGFCGRKATVEKSRRFYKLRPKQTCQSHEGPHAVLRKVKPAKKRKDKAEEARFVQVWRGTDKLTQYQTLCFRGTSHLHSVGATPANSELVAWFFRRELVVFPQQNRHVRGLVYVTFPSVDLHLSQRELLEISPRSRQGHKIFSGQ